MAAQRARWLWRAGLGLVASLTLLLGLAVAKRSELAEFTVIRALAARGVPARLRVERLDLQGAEISGLALGAANAPDLRIAHASLAWSLDGLRARRLDRIALRGVRARARVDATGLRLGALDALFAGDSAAGAPLALPFAEARLDDVEALIDSSQGTLLLRVAGEALPEGELVRATLALHGESEKGALDFGGGATVGLASQEVAAAGALRGTTPWGSADGNLRVLGSFAEPRIEFRGSALPDPSALPLRTAGPVAVLGTASRDAAGLWTADATLAVAEAELPGTARVLGIEIAATLRGAVASAKLSARELELIDVGSFSGLSVDARREGEGVSAAIDARAGLLPELARLAGIHVDARYVDESLDADVRVAKLVELSQPALVAPLSIEANLSGPLAKLALEGKARTPGDGFVFGLRGAVEAEAGCFDVAIAVAETDLAPAPRQLAQAFPWLAGVVLHASGSAGLEALAHFADGELAASALIALRDVDVQTEYATLRGLSGLVSITDLDPLTTPPGQTLWMESVDAALPLASGSASFALAPGDVIVIERGEWGLAGGKLLLSGTLPLEAEERRVELRAEGISVEQILAALDFDGLSGTGSLQGTIPVLQRGAAVFVEAGELRSTEPGVIRFAGSAAELALKQPALATVLGALENLEYDELGLTLSGNVADRMDVKLHIRGRNPNFQAGRPVVLNVNIDAPVGSLLKAGLVVTSVPEEIEGQVQRFFGQEKK